MKLKLLDPVFAICKLPPQSEIPAWILESELFFLAKTSDELSIICPVSDVPRTMDRSTDWRCLRVDGDLEFEQVGVVATVTSPLSNAGLSLFLVSTHDRDYVLVHQDNLSRAIDIYREQGFIVNANL